jgi:hypothetical protein
VLLIVLFQILDPAWKIHSHRLDQILFIWFGSLFSIVTCAVLLMAKKAEWKWLLVCALVTGLMMRPYGFPRSFSSYSPFPVAGVDLTQERLLSNADSANTNLLRQYERVGVFDPILNKTLADLMVKQFPVMNGFLHLQLPQDAVITKKQLDLLRLMGVTSIYGYAIEGNPAGEAARESFIRLQDPLPRVFLLRSTEAIEASCQKQDYGTALTLARAGIDSRATELQKGVNHLQFRLDRPGGGTLVALQAFSPAWHLGEQPATRFCGAFTAWKGDFHAGQTYQVRYVPPGLGTSYGFALGGAGLLVLAMGLCRWRSPSSQETTHPFPWDRQ